MVCPGTSTEVADFPRLDLLFTAQSNRFLANLHSKLECPPIMKNVFPEIMINFRILNFYSEIWRTRKKTYSAFKVDLGFDRGLRF
jgi:hypothetical protein